MCYDKKLLSKVIAVWIVAAVCGVILLSGYAYARSMNGGGTIPATAVAPYIKVNHGAKPDPLQLKSIMQNFPKGTLQVPKDIPKLNLSVQNNNTININKTLSNNVSNDTQSVKFLSAINPVDVNAGVGYVEVEFRDMDLGQYIESQGVKTKDGSNAVYINMYLKIRRLQYMYGMKRKYHCR